jgi:GTPase
VDNKEFRCGTIAIVGRPNVGKSTLLNLFVGEKISITSRKPQTTRNTIRGFLTNDDAQFIFVDTPGFQREHKNALTRAMDKSIGGTLLGVDVALLVIQAGEFGADDKTMLSRIPESVPVILVVNKVDRIEKSAIPPLLSEYAKLDRISDIVPVSAKHRRNIDELLKVIREKLPVAQAIYPADELTDRSERFLAAERIREKLFRSLGEEVPYGAGVVIEKFSIENGMRRIHAAIIVDREGHKPIIIGARGAKLKEIGSLARVELERLFQGKVYLEIWVKVRRGWTDDAMSVSRLGYE